MGECRGRRCWVMRGWVLRRVRVRSLRDDTHEV